MNSVTTSAFCETFQQVGSGARFVPVPFSFDYQTAIERYFEDLIRHDLLKYRLPEVKNPGVDAVWDMVMSPGHACFMVFDYATREFAAEFMLNNFQGLSAMVHFSIHPSHHGREGLRMAEDVLRWLAKCRRTEEEDLPYVKTLIGLTPKSNRLACRFLTRAGFSPLGFIPDAFFLAYNECFDTGMLSIKLLEDV